MTAALGTETCEDGRVECAAAEVNQFNIATFGDQNVLMREIQMNNVVAVTVVQRADDLATKFASLLFSQPSPADDVVKQLTAITVPKKKEPVIVVASKVPQVAYVRMIH